MSVYPNPPTGPDSNFYFSGDPMKPALPATTMDPFSVPAADISIPDDLNRKVRKPYTITKSRESWTELEHDKFLEALTLFDRDWKKIEAFVGSKTVIQIRSHAQKYFLKVQKSGASDHVPPPRPKRKASRPYPQKAPAVTGPPSTQSEPGYVTRPDPLTVPATSLGSAVSRPWTCSSMPGLSASPAPKDDIQLLGASCSKESTPGGVLTANETSDQGKDKQNKETRVVPDFAQVYSYIGSIFDPNSSDHMQKLKQMDPINVETAVMLMKNLCINLVSPEFEDVRRMIVQGTPSQDLHIKSVKHLK